MQLDHGDLVDGRGGVVPAMAFVLFGLDCFADFGGWVVGLYFFAEHCGGWSSTIDGCKVIVLPYRCHSRDPPPCLLMLQLQYVRYVTSAEIPISKLWRTTDDVARRLSRTVKLLLQPGAPRFPRLPHHRTNPR